MRVPIRKPGQHTFQKSDPHITLDKFNELKNKLERLKKFSQPRAIAEVKRLALDGDFSENAAYQIAKGRLRGINQGILEIEEHLKRAEIIKTPTNNGRIQLGNHVIVESNGRTRTFLILGSAETDPTAGVISRNSPLGAALLGHKIGDKIQIKLAEKAVEYKIINIK